MLVVGLTGGIGSGKSAVSRLLADLGCAVIDADLVAREVVAPGTPGLAAVVAAFGDGVLLSDGSLDRPALGSLVFADDAARGRLNGIVHPLVGERTAQLVAEAHADVVVHDVPLLVENGLAPGYHLVLVVDAPVTVRLERLRARGLPEEQARARMAAQSGDEARRAVADAWLDNGTDVAALHEQVVALHGGRLVPYVRNLTDGRPAEGSTSPADVPRLVARLRRLCPTALDVDAVAADTGLELVLRVGDRGAGAGLPGGGFPVVPGAGGLHRAADPGRPASVRVSVDERLE